jgi:hypothetical protein
VADPSRASSVRRDKQAFESLFNDAHLADSLLGSASFRLMTVSFFLRRLPSSSSLESEKELKEGSRLLRKVLRPRLSVIAIGNILNTLVVQSQQLFSRLSSNT